MGCYSAKRSKKRNRGKEKNKKQIKTRKYEATYGVAWGRVVGERGRREKTGAVAGGRWTDLIPVPFSASRLRETCLCGLTKAP